MSIAQVGAAVYIMPDVSVDNTIVVSDKTVDGVLKLDIQVNGVDNYFTVGSVIQVTCLNGSGTGLLTFENNTSLVTVVMAGSGATHFIGGSGTDMFIGGSGVNTFDCGSGYTVAYGGSKSNVFNESLIGSGTIVKGTNGVVHTQVGAIGVYMVY